MSKFETAFRQLNTAQRKAVEAIEGPVLVIAGPGTGKTQLLSLRVANILRKTDVNPGNILCLTFTESGQSAMRERLTDLLGKAAKQLEIHTFHGFGTHLINHFAEYFPDLSGSRPADDLALYEVLVSCFGELPRANPLSKLSYGQFVYQDGSKSRISQLKQAGITPQQAKLKFQSDLDWATTAGRKIARAFEEVGRLQPKAIAGLQNKVADYLKSSESDGLAACCETELSEALQAAEITGKTETITAFKKKWLSNEDGKQYFKPADQLKKLVALADLYNLYEKELRARKLYDYDDMILYALQALKENRELRAQIQETYQYILADEYQDTNAAQASLITLIADNPVNEGRPNVMAVGDDDQAIYGFQGALGDVMLDFRERWRDVKVITLKENYRSTQSIINAARALINNGQNRLENIYDDIDKSLTSKADHPDVNPLIVETTSPDAVIDNAVRASQSADSSSQLAIVASKHKYLQSLADRLDAAKVKYYYEGREDILKDPIINQLLLLAGTATAINRSDFARSNYSLPEIFATGPFTISRETAWQVAIRARLEKLSWWEALSGLKQADAISITESLSLSAGSIDSGSALATLREIATQHNFKVLRKIKALVGHAEKYYGRTDISLTDLLQYAQLCLQAGISLSGKIVKGRSDANVVLLSAHKSKGLEFDRVYILHADNYTWLKEKGRSNILSLPEGWKHLEPSSQTFDDRLRLLYVVMTRAKKELTLIRSGGQNDSLPGLESLSVSTHVSEQLQAFAQEPDKIWQNWYLPRSTEEQQNLKRLLQPLLKNYRLSPSHLTTFLDIPNGGPAIFLTYNLLGISEPPHSEALFGNRVHESLYFAQRQLNETGQLPTEKQIAKYLLKKYDMSEAALSDVTEVVDSFLKNTKVLQPGGVGEYSFSNQSLSLNDLRLTGTVDNFFVKEEKLIVTDFKTGRALNSWKVSEDYYRQKLHRFRQQLLFYELLFRLSPEFKMIESTELKVAFVEPSRRDVYCELVCQADEDERLSLQGLMAAVWRKINDVDFPDVTKYSFDFKGVEDFEADLLAGRV